MSESPTGTDPSQFVDYLRAVSSSTKSLGAATIRGVSTTHYRATIDLTRYAKLVPPSQRAAAQRGISTLESALGSHTLPIDAWIDRKNLVRRIGGRRRSAPGDISVRPNEDCAPFTYAVGGHPGPLRIGNVLTENPDADLRQAQRASAQAAAG